MTHSSTLRRILDRPNPLLKQTPSVAAWLIALGLVAFSPEIAATNVILFTVGSGLIIAATLWAGWMSVLQRHDGLLVYLIPMIDIVGFGLFRAGTGGVHSLFGALILIPVVWLATAPGVRCVLVVALLTSLNYMLPYFIAPPSSGFEWMRGVISPLVFAAVALVINELSRQQRKRAEEAERLVAERSRVIAVNESMIDQLQAGEKVHQALLESFESLWRSITAQAIFATDTTGTVQAWTPGAERILGLSEQQAVGKVNVERFFPSAELAELVNDCPPVAEDSAAMNGAGLAAGVRALFAGVDAGIPAEIQMAVIAVSGNQIPARVTVTQRRDGDGQHLGYLLVITDESRAAEVARMKDEFVGMVSHELRTPLSSIIGFLDLLKNDPEQPLTPDQSDFVAVIERNASRLLALVGDLLFTAQVESGSFPLSYTEFDLSRSLINAVQSAQPSALRSEVELVAELPDEPLIMSADATRIGQVIDNLMSNAIKFTPRGGRVVVGARALPGHVELRVQDTGLGIPQTEIGQLFKRFFRATTATRNAVPGIGLGLTVTRAIVIAHGGTVSVTSEEERGTEFLVTLPLVKAADPPIMLEPTPTG